MRNVALTIGYLFLAWIVLSLAWSAYSLVASLF